MAYFANGSEGEIFDDQCNACPLGDLNCPIASVQFGYNYDACNNKVASEILDCLVSDKTKLCALRELLMGEQKLEIAKKLIARGKG